jgi:hypothetical protein
LEVVNPVTFRHVASPAQGTLPAAIVWSRDPQRLWAVRQDIADPSGSALSPLSPAQLDLGGEWHDLPPLRHSAGPLDGLRWIGSDGIALAQFGMKGRYYRPEHRDPDPTYAVVDAARGRVRATLRLRDIPELAGSADDAAVLLTDASAGLLPGRRVRSILTFGRRPDGRARRLVWTEGERAIVLPDADGGRSARSANLEGTALSPDGRTLLIFAAIQPSGLMVADCRKCSPTPPPKPIVGNVARLLDITSGRTIWRLPVRVAQFWDERTPPAISPDGRYAAVQLPPERGRAMIGLLAMADGRLLARWSAVEVGSYPQAFVFGPDSRTLWVTCAGLVQRYRLSEG